MVVPVGKISEANDKAVLWDPDDGSGTFTDGIKFTSGDPEVITHHGVGTRATDAMATAIELLPSQVTGAEIYKDSTWDTVEAALGITRYVE